MKYQRKNVAAFFRTRELFGELSNMHSGFPIVVNDLRYATSESLYQACRFPDSPDVQRKIQLESHPMKAKALSREFMDQTRSDWNDVRVDIMRWSIRMKLACNWESFGKILRSTGQKPIVEISRKDDFWGCFSIGDEELVGQNVLGRLLDELRDDLEQGIVKPGLFISPPDIQGFRILGEKISSHGKGLSRVSREQNDQLLFFG